ncbi:MAG: MFS transporter [Christensenellales bacterium]|jgi:PPP family 3-phenylpropionic acid transporter
MSKTKKPAFRIEINYAALQASFWVSYLVYQGFTAVFLSFHGFSDTQIGITSSLLSILAIAFQLTVSSFTDNHNNIPIKKIMAAIMLMSMVCGAIILKVPLSIALMSLVFSIGGAFQHTNSALINAQIMQYVNAGVPVNYGWPRGIGSITYALFAYIIGLQLEIHSPSILMPIFCVVSLLSVVIVMLMPNVEDVSKKNAHIYVHEKYSGRTSYRQMLSENSVLRLFLLASVLLYVGMTPSLLFLVNVIEGVGGGGRELGISMLIQSGVEMPAMFLVPMLLKKVKSRYLLVVCFFAYFVKMLVLSFAGTMPTVYFAMAMSVLCYGLYGVSSTIFANSIVSGGEKVRAQGLVILASNMGGILGNVIAGLLLDNAGLKYLFYVSCAIEFLAAAVMLLCARKESLLEKQA